MSRVAAVIVGLVFLASGALKARDPGWPAAAGALGTPALFVPFVAPVELALGALMVVGLWQRPVAMAALVLLLAFTAVLARALSQDEAPVCACFGSWSARPISARSVARNVAFMALAAVAAL